MLVNYIKNVAIPQRLWYYYLCIQKGFAGMKKNSVSLMILALLGVMVYAYYFNKGFQLAVSPIHCDMYAHIGFAENFYLNPTEFLKYWLKVPYCLWHLIVKTLSSRLGVELYHAGAFVFAVFGVLAYTVNTLLVYSVIKSLHYRHDTEFAAVLGAALCFVGPYNIDYLGDAYLIAFSPNPMHNPTHMAVKAFGMLTFMAGVDMMRDYRSEERLFFPGIRKLPLLFGLFLFLSTVTKPTFMYMLLPAGVITVLTDLCISLIRKKKESLPRIGRTVLRFFLASVPALIYLFIEYLAFYYWGNSAYHSSVIFTRPLTVWHFTAINVPMAILIGMCFPLFMFLTDIRYFLSSAEGRLAAVGYAVGVLEFSVLAESGAGMDAANFAWCMMAGMTVFFAVGLSRLAFLTLDGEASVASKIRITAAWVLFGLHIYGFLSYYRVI